MAEQKVKREQKWFRHRAWEKKGRGANSASLKEGELGTKNSSRAARRLKGGRGEDLGNASISAIKWLRRGAQKRIVLSEEKWLHALALRREGKRRSKRKHLGRWGSAAVTRGETWIYFP